MTLVVDASVIVAALVDSGRDGEWAATVLEGQALAAPHHMPIESANILRRAALAGDLTADTGPYAMNAGAAVGFCGSRLGTSRALRVSVGGKMAFESRAA